MSVRYAVRPGIRPKDSKYLHTGNLQILDNVNVEVPGLRCTYKIISHVQSNYVLIYRTTVALSH